MSTDNNSAMRVLGGLARIFKNIPKEHLEQIEDVSDMWNEKDGHHKVPGRAEIVTGPAEEASGAGADKMIARYSPNLAPQIDGTQLYIEFDRNFSDFKKSINDRMAKSDEAIGALLNVFKSMAAETAAPAAPSSLEDTFVGKSNEKLAKARKALRKAEFEDEDEEGKENRKAHLAAAKKALEAAKRFLAKAEEDGEDEKHEDEVEKALSTLKSLSKSLAKAEKEDEEKEEAEKAKSATSATAKSEDLPGEKEAVEEGEDNTAPSKKSAPSADDVAKALAGLKVLETNMQDLMNTVAGKGSLTPAPEMMKGIAPIVDVETRVTEAIDNEELVAAGDVMIAKSLLSQYRNAQAGKLDAAIARDAIMKAPANVRQYFVPVAA